MSKRLFAFQEAMDYEGASSDILLIEADTINGALEKWHNSIYSSDDYKIDNLIKDGPYYKIYCKKENMDIFYLLITEPTII